MDPLLAILCPKASSRPGERRRPDLSMSAGEGEERVPVGRSSPSSDPVT